jgi:hypothetical protein
LSDCLRRHIERTVAGDYFAILAYVDMRSEFAVPLESIRHRIGRARKVATTVGFGPRFQHSTGQAHKGGPNTGVFLILMNLKHFLIAIQNW